MLAKTHRPRLPPVYQRARLFEWLDDARRLSSATLVTGPPGAGKTTLLASYLQSRNLRCIWYQVDSGDEDVATFFYFLGHAAQVHIPPDVEPVPAFDPAKAPDVAMFGRRFFRHLYSSVTAPTLIVLDNYQELAEDSALHDVVRVACEEAPDNCHVFIASREACPTPLARLQFNQTLSVLDAGDLALTLEETRGILESRGAKPPSAAATLALQNRSAGWMMGLILVLERTHLGNHETDLSLSLREGREEPVFDYFVGEVFRKLDTNCRDLLLQCALLPRMTVSRVVRLTGLPQAGDLLLELSSRNRFVTRHGIRESTYQFHPLFREFLLNRGAARYPDADLAALRCRAAEVLLSDDEVADAIELLDQAQSWRRMAEVILTSASQLWAQGRIATLDVWMRKIPADLIDADPWLLYWQGSSKAFFDPAAGQVVLAAAYLRFSAIDDVQGMARSWSELIDAILKCQRNLQQMDPLVAEFNARLKDRLRELPPDLSDRVILAFFIALSFRQPMHPNLWFWLGKVREMFEAEKYAPERPVLRHHLVTYHLLRGEHAEAEAVLNRFHFAGDGQESDEPSRALVDYVSEAMVTLHLGMRNHCLRAVHEGLRAGRELGNHAFDPLLLHHGIAMSMNRGDLAQADELLTAFGRLAHTSPSIDSGRYHAVLAWRKFYAGEPASALALFRIAAAASQARGAPYFIASNHLAFGLLSSLCGDTSEALLSLETGRNIGIGIENLYIEYIYQLFSAQVALSLGREGQAHDHLVSGMRLGREHGYMHFVCFPSRVIARVCLAALEAGIEVHYVRSLIERNELTPDPAWRKADFWPWPVRIYTLGRFGVVKHEAPLRHGGKAQRKPLELLKGLIALGGRDVPEARLADILWPEAEGDAAAQALATTLFRLRKLIGDPAIRRQEGRLTLDATYCWVDCWAFQRSASDDSSGKSVRLERLRRFYQGPFLEGDDAPWVRPMRDRLHAMFTHLAEK